MKFEALGPLAVVTDDGAVRLRPAQRRLLASLLLDADIEVSTDKLIDRMWNGTPPATARNTLHAHMSALRRSLPGPIESGPDWYRLQPNGHDFDVPLFTSLAAEATASLTSGEPAEALERAQRALSLWRGDPYPELADVDAARPERARLRELYVSVGAMMSEALTSLGRLPEALSLLRRLVIEHPLNEALQEQLCLCLYVGGRPADALRAVGEARRRLGEELGVEPGPRLRDLEDKILLHHPDLDPRSGPTPGPTLPNYRTSFVGRDGDVSGLLDLIDRYRLVSITGGPGIGKTRLAIEVGNGIRDRFPGGVILIRLVGSVSEADVAATIASGVGIADTATDLTELRRHISGRRSLVILDNCEHVLTAVQRFLGHDEGTEALHVLTTSRTTLGVPGEQVWRLQPLEVPDGGERVYEYASVRLLSDRVSATRGASPFEHDDNADLIRLCRRTGGIPLALELAARWVPWVGLREAADLGFEAAPTQADPTTPHHVSLAQAIDWSVEVLASSDRDAFRSASAFMGTFTLDGFWRVCLPDHSRRQAASTIARLVDASLVTVERMGLVRYRMLEPLREHARAGLDPDSLGTLAERHADWFLERATEVGRLAKGPEEAAFLAEVDEDLVDLRATMRHLLDVGRPEAVATIAMSLSRYWFTRYLGTEAQRWLTEALAGDMDPDIRLGALSAAGWAAYGTAAYDQAESHYEECLRLATSTGDRHREAEALYGLARIHLPRRTRDGEALLREALAIFDEVGAELHAADCRLWLGLRAANAGQTEAAVPWLSESIGVLESLGHLGNVSVGHRYLSLAAWYDGDEAAARRQVDRAESVARAADDKRALGGALIQRGLVEGRWGDPAVAAHAIINALAPIPDNNDIDYCLISFGAFPALIRTARWQTAARLLAHLDRMYDDYGWTPLDDRLPMTAEFRTAITENLVRSRLTVDETPVSSAAMAAELVDELAAIAAG